MEAATCNARRVMPYIPWAVAVLAALALAGALAAALASPDAGRDLVPRHAAGTLRATAI